MIRALALLTPLALLAACGTHTVTVATTPPPTAAAPAGPLAWQAMPFMDASLPRERRVADLLARLTLEEKASQLVNQSRAIPRLGIPAYNWWSEGLHGVANTTATVFPEPIGLGATFDPDAIREMGAAIGAEGRAKYNALGNGAEHKAFGGITFWSPNVNIFRDPRWGRGQETYGEDPFLTARLGVAYVGGMQGDDERYLRVAATPKHFAVHSGPEATRHTVDVVVSRHDEEDTYLPAFRATVVEGHAASVMCAYNSVNGQPACANDFLLKDVLRKAWGFRGYVVGDCGAVADIDRGHHFVKSPAEAAAASVKAGTDSNCVGYLTRTDGSDYAPLLAAVKQGLLTEADLDTALARLFTARLALGMFDPPAQVLYAAPSAPPAPRADGDAHDDTHKQLARKLARESLVLLKNDGVLPLAPTVKRVLVVGPLADQVQALEGNYHGTAARYVTALAGIRAQFPHAEVTYEPGTIFLRRADVVAANLLTHGDKNEPGLQAEFFRTKELAGAPLVARVDADVSYGKGGNRLPAGVTASFIRWTGSFTPRESGVYRLGTNGLMDRLYIDGKLVVDDTSRHQPQDKTAELTLKAGHRYAVRLEFIGGQEPNVRFVALRQAPHAVEHALAVARKADVIIGVVGLTPDVEGEEMKLDVPGFSAGDRTSLDLPAPEEKLMEALSHTGKPLVAVLMNGSALGVTWLQAHASAILEAWYPGQEGGTAIAETLSGANNPSGKLPVTFYKSVDGLPPFADYSMHERTYRYFHGEPLYPFGFGLSYSKFELRDLHVGNGSLPAGDPQTVDVEVSNVAGPAAEQVIELYLTPPDTSSPPGSGALPIRALRALGRVHLDAGEHKKVSLVIPPRELGFVSAEGEHVILPGTYKVSVGTGQPRTDVASVEGTFAVSGQKRLPE